MITDIYMTKAKEGVTVDQFEELINAETWMSESEASECRASDYFNIIVDESAEAVAACVGYMIDRFKHAPSVMKTETAEDIEETKQQAYETEEILGDLYMYGI